MPDTQDEVIQQEEVQQDDDAAVVDDQPGDTPSGEGDQADQDYLVVNERTRYKTREDAVRGFNEAGERISALSPYAEIIERNGIADPATLQDILADYRELRSAAAKNVKQEDRGQAPTQRQEAAVESNLSPDDKKNVEYLKRLGYTSNEAILKTIDDKFNQLKNEIGQRFQQLDSTAGQLTSQHQQQLIESGRSVMTQQLGEKGYDASDPEVNEMIENAITNWMNANSYTDKGRLIPGSPLDKFYRGGQALQEAVRQGLDRVLSATNKMRIQADGKYQQSKQQKVAKTAKPLPKGSQHGVEDSKKGSRKEAPRPGAGSIFMNRELHDKAFEIMQKQGSSE